MKFWGGIVLLLYCFTQVAGCDTFADDDRGTLPPNVRTAPGGILLWHSGFMGGK